MAKADHEKTLAGHGWPWLAMADHEKALAGQGWPWLVVADHAKTLVGHGWPWAIKDQPLPALSGYGWLFPFFGRPCYVQDVPLEGPKTKMVRKWSCMAKAGSPAHKGMDPPHSCSQAQLARQPVPKSV